MKAVYKCLPLLAVILIGLGFAEEVKPVIDRGENLPSGALPDGYNSYARFDTKRTWDFYIQGSFIYWQLKESNLEYGYVMPYPAPLEHSDSMLSLSFPFKPGYKVAMGLALPNHDNWMINADYTWLHTKTKSSTTTTDIYQIYEYWVYFPSVLAAYAEASWLMRYNMFDFNFSRPAYFGSSLVLKPHAGLRGGWIHQTYRAYYENSDASYISFNTIQERSWMVGPRLGVDGDWLLGAGFKFFANGAASLLYKHFKDRIFDRVFDASPELLHFSHTQDRIAPALEAGLGFAWGSYFANKGCHFDFTLGYDFQVFFEQNSLRTMNDVAVLAIISNGHFENLFTQGLTASMRFDF